MKENLKIIKITAFSVVINLSQFSDLKQSEPLVLRGDGKPARNILCTVT